MKPRRRICDQTDTPPAASAAELVPNVLGFLSFGAYQQCREGDPDARATQVLHIICPGLHPEEDTSASPHGINTTPEAAVIGYKLYCLTGIEQGTRGCFQWWERSSDLTGQLPLASSWAAPSQIGAVPPQFVCLIGCMGLWTTPDKQIVIIAPNKTKEKHKVPALKLGTWNVRTMTPDLSDNLQQVSDA